MDESIDDVEALSRPERRARLPFRRLLRLYLDPFALFKNVSVGSRAARTAALEYNRRQRPILLVYARRWTIIAAASLLGATWAGAAAAADPLLGVSFFGLEITFSLSFCMVLLSATVYVLLGGREPPT